MAVSVTVNVGLYEVAVAVTVAVIVGRVTVVTSQVLIFVIVTRFVTVVVCVTTNSGASPPAVVQAETVVHLRTHLVEVVTWKFCAFCFAFENGREKIPTNITITMGTSTRSLRELMKTFSRPSQRLLNK